MTAEAVLSPLTVAVDVGPFIADYNDVDGQMLHDIVHFVF